MTSNIKSTLLGPSDFKTMPWKNGLGSTIELLAKYADDSDQFLWRLSIADVSSDGAFSDFRGYDRILTLLTGQGITLFYEDNDSNETGKQQEQDALSQPLEKARFSGDTRTSATLHAGAIQDFNVMTRRDKCSATVSNFTNAKQQSISLTGSTCMIYAHQEAVTLSNQEGDCLNIPVGHLLVLEDLNTYAATLTGAAIITVQISS